MSLESKIIVFVIEVKTFWKEVVFGDVLDILKISQALSKSYFCCETSCFLKMVHKLSILKIVIIDFSALECILQIKAWTTTIRITIPTSLH